VTVRPATWGAAQPDLTDEQRHLWPGGGYLGSASTWPHTPGALAEQLVVRRDQVRRLPASLPVKRAALAEPLAVGLHGLTVGGGVGGKRVLISGSGPIGLLTAAAAQLRARQRWFVPTCLQDRCSARGSWAKPARCRSGPCRSASRTCRTLIST
jgi:L-idonate 5-dehydrogenase